MLTIPPHSDEVLGRPAGALLLWVVFCSNRASHADPLIPGRNKKTGTVYFVVEFQIAEKDS